MIWKVVITNTGIVGQGSYHMSFGSLPRNTGGNRSETKWTSTTTSITYNRRTVEVQLRYLTFLTRLGHLCRMSRCITSNNSGRSRSKVYSRCTVNAPYLQPSFWEDQCGSLGSSECISRSVEIVLERQFTRYRSVRIFCLARLIIPWATV